MASYRREEAISGKNWPKPRAKHKHGVYINKQHRPDRSVVCQTSKRADDHKVINNMDNSTRLRFQTRHLPEWITIRDIPDEEPHRSYQGPGAFEAPWRSPPDRVTSTPPASDEIRRITVAPAPTYRTPGIQPPGNTRDVHGSLYDEDSAQYPLPIKDETLEEMRRTRYPTTIRANLRRSPSSSPEAPRPRTSNIDSGDHRNDQDSFRDILDDEPVLPMGNQSTRNKSNEDSTAATFAGYGRDDREEGTGDHSSDSSGSSMRDAARFGRSPRPGLTRPRSYVLRDEAYVALTDLRNTRPNNTNHICQECKNGSRCWCPVREESPNTNGRGPRSLRLERCRTCGKMYVIIGASRQWCCQDWVSSRITHTLAPSRSPPPDR